MGNSPKSSALVVVDPQTGELKAGPNTDIELLQYSPHTFTCVVKSRFLGTTLGYLRIAPPADIEREVAVHEILRGLHENFAPRVLQSGKSIRFKNSHQDLDFRIVAPVEGTSFMDAPISVEQSRLLFVQIAITLATMHDATEGTGLDDVLPPYDRGMFMRNIEDGKYLEMLEREGTVPKKFKKRFNDLKSRLPDLLQKYLSLDDTIEKCIVHGDPNAQNILVLPSGLFSGFIDFGEAHYGNPVEDVVFVTTYLIPPLADLFLDAYLLYRKTINPEFDESNFLKHLVYLRPVAILVSIADSGMKRKHPQVIDIQMERLEKACDAIRVIDPVIRGGGTGEMKESVVPLVFSRDDTTSINGAGSLSARFVRSQEHEFR